MYALSRFLDALFPPRDTDLIVRDTSLEALLEIMDPITLHEGNVTALFPYRDPIVHALVIEAKYHGNKRAASLLGAALTDYLLEDMYEETAVEKKTIALVPLPLSGSRKRERGYNQVEEVLKETQKALLYAVLDVSVLSRIRSTAPQTRLTKTERQQNVAGAFAAGAPNPRYLYIVIDDVVTTGATLTEAVGALTNKGANARALALAY